MADRHLIEAIEEIDSPIVLRSYLIDINKNLARIAKSLETKEQNNE